MTTNYLISFVPPDPELGVDLRPYRRTDGERALVHRAASGHHVHPSATGHCSDPDRYPRGHGRTYEQRITERPRIARKRPGKQAPEAMGRRLLEIVVYDKRCRIGGTLTLDDLAETPRSVTGRCPTSRPPARTRRLRVG